MLTSKTSSLSILMIAIVTLLVLPVEPIPAQSLEEAEKLYEEGTRLRLEGRWAEAVIKLSEAVQIYSAVEAYHETMVAVYWMGECLVQLGQYEMALEMYTLALSLAERVGTEGDQAQILNMLGISHFHLQHYDEAITYYEKALEIHERLGNTEQVAVAHGNLGAAHTDAGRLEPALAHYLEAVRLFEDVSNQEQLASRLADVGLTYEDMGRYDQAAEYYERSARAYAKLSNKERERFLTYKAAVMQKNLGWFEKARDSFTRALKLLREAGDREGVASTLLLLGEIEDALGNYRKALELYEEVLEIDRRSGQPLDVAASLNHIAAVYIAWGRYDEALEYYRESLEITRKQGHHDGTATNLASFGDLYTAWGRYDEALEYYEQALALHRKYGHTDGTANVLTNMGNLFSLMGRSEEAFDSTEKALALFEELGDRAGVATLLNNLGQLHNTAGDYETAVQYFERALKLNKELGLKRNEASVLNNLGALHSDGRADDEQAIMYFRRALEIFEEMGSREWAAHTLNNIGVSYGRLERYGEAAGHLNRSVDLKEELRLTAQGAVRRDYLASQLYTYQVLTSVYAKSGRAQEAFDTVELASSKYLVEQMGERQGAPRMRFRGIEAYRRSMPNDRAVINYSNVATHEMVQIFADRERIVAVEVTREEFLKTVMEKHGRRIRRATSGLRGFKPKSGVKPGDRNTQDDADREAFDSAVTYYRQLLSQPRLNRMERSAMDSIGRALYDLLILPLEPHLEAKQELLILPDGILAFLPFEALIDPDGRYLVERFHVRYIQSLTVAQLVQDRSYPETRKPMLAVGGAVYDAPRYEEQMITNERQLDYLVKETIEALEEGGTTRGAYAALGMDAWSNLPGTLAEVKTIARIFPRSLMLTGESAAEAGIKEMSAKGELRDYEVIHLATHGLVVPEIPELSAIVLSLFDGNDGSDDGYLNMKEIAELDIRADFVNLSACETGLGRIYGGEGVVGLTQSFLIAGARGLSVSLWQVADESTMRFMTGLYSLVTERGWEYHRALTEMKRTFISDPELSHPFYWAPFVYYGW